MKKAYSVPKLVIVEIENECIVETSDPVGISPSSSASEDYEALGNRRNNPIWDD